LSYGYFPELFRLHYAGHAKSFSPPVLIPSTLCMSGGDQDCWFYSSAINNLAQSWQQVFYKYVKSYRKNKSEKILEQIHDEIQQQPLVDVDNKVGRIEFMERPEANFQMFVFKHFYRLCKDIVTPDDFDD